MYPSLESSPDRSVELPRDIGCAEDEDTFRVFAYTVHLDKKFGFYAPRSFGFAFTTGAAECIDFVYEDDGRFVFASKVEELLH